MQAWHNQLEAGVQEQVRALVAPIDQNLVCSVVLQGLVAWHQMVVQWLDLFEQVHHLMHQQESFHRRGLVVVAVAVVPLENSEILGLAVVAVHADYS